MKTENDVAPTGTGQAGAGTPAGVQKDVPVKPTDKMNRIADRAAHKGKDRQHKGDATIFTK
jgi:hypothetical protein